MTTNYTIRVETPADYAEVSNLVRESFWNVYAPGCTEHYVIEHLRKSEGFIKELSFVMEKNGRIIGQNIFFKTEITASDGTKIPVLTMGPICIANDLKRQGYGKILLDYSFEKAAELGFGAVFFEGNIDFYGKSGCEYASKYNIRYHLIPEGSDPSCQCFFLCKVLKPGYLGSFKGVYAPPKAYFVAEENLEDFERFEHEFNLKKPLKKLKLPGQLV